MANDLTQWSTSVPFASAQLSWVPPLDQERINSYAVYESIYWNVPEAFKIVQRGSDSKPIYIPAARQVIETMHRYLAPKLSIVCDQLLGSTTEQAEALAYFEAFSRRERFLSKFSSNKRYGLIRGDWLFHIVGDELREEGARVSIETIDPAEYFPIYADDQITIIGAHLIALMVDENGDEVMYRQTYRKTNALLNPPIIGGPSPITVEESFFEVDAWGGPDMEEKSIAVIRPLTELPPDITHIPIYHIPNLEEPGSVYGSSELRGIERVLVAINQSISDEEIELVLNGLGVYVTDAGSPEDEDTGEPIPWNLGPAKVVELPEGKTFIRVSGTTTVEPHQAHLSYLHSQLDQSTGMNDITAGRADVATAESGIALLIRLAPLFARADEKELIITDVMTQMLFDLKSFFAAYEGQNFDNIAFLPKYGDRLPLDANKRFEQIMTLAAMDPPVVSSAWIRKELRKIGWEITESDQAMMKAIMSEREQIATSVDVFGAQQAAVLAAAGAAGAAGAGVTDPPAADDA